MRKEKEEKLERERVAAKRKKFVRIRLDTPGTPTGINDGKRKRRGGRNGRMGSVQVHGEKIKVMIDNYKKKKLRNSLSIVDRTRICERDTRAIF